MVVITMNQVAMAQFEGGEDGEVDTRPNTNDSSNLVE
jgi:hypothetical protein